MSDETNSIQPLPISRTALQESSDESIKDNRGTIALGGRAEIHDRTGLYISIIALVIAALALGMAIMMPILNQARIESEKAKIEVLTEKYVLEERQGRMVEYYIHEIDGKLISANVIKPSQNFENFKQEHKQ